MSGHLTLRRVLRCLLQSFLSLSSFLPKKGELENWRRSFFYVSILFLFTLFFKAIYFYIPYFSLFFSFLFFLLVLQGYVFFLLYMNFIILVSCFYMDSLLESTVSILFTT